MTLRYGRGWKIVPETDREAGKMIDVDWMLQMERETNGMTEGLFLFQLERLLGEARLLATAALAHCTVCIGDKDNGLFSSTRASEGCT